MSRLARVAVAIEPAGAGVVTGRGTKLSDPDHGRVITERLEDHEEEHQPVSSIVVFFVTFVGFSIFVRLVVIPSQAPL